MIIELVRKELIKNRGTQTKNKFVSFLKYFFILLLLGGFVAFECFVFLSLDKKINTYSNNGAFHFLVFFLFILLIISIFSTSIRARGAIFDEVDRRVIAVLPITGDEIIISKMISIYLRQVAVHMLTSAPLLICYGATRGMIPYFYVFSALYPFLVSLLCVGIGLILVIVIELIYRFIRNKEVLQIVLASFAVIALCWAYQYLLQLFLDALNDSQIGGVFSSQFIDFLTKNSKLMFPVYNICEALLLGKNVTMNVCFFGGLILVSLAVGFVIVTYFHDLFVKATSITKAKGNASTAHVKVTSPFKALITKEIDLLFKNSTYLISYTALLIMCPFLSYVVISSLDAIVYSNLRFYAVYFPEVINCINICLVLLFSGVINATATISMTREGKALQIIKYVPIHAYKQILAKIFVPALFSSFSLLLTLGVLKFTGTITWTAFIVCLIVDFTLIVINNIIGILFDMHDKGVCKYHYKPWLRIISIGFPLVIFVTQFILSLTKVPSIIMYIIIIVLGLSLLGVMCINIRKRFIKAFRKMEAN